ncbi:hypothetical protein [Pseudomonas umsongensis]|jgi:hypothetical protein|uniref:hypothetical protein n=1 Tax=Pseudomonas umsongensis TaxID=198618 RepID=UPI0015BEC2A0|nr:hypothetical protein [Pseudomonas umsongensis]NWL21281.1 hypothetical protein [Pseudomonas umsongensis]
MKKIKPSAIFNALCKEAMFSKELLGSGVTQIRKANYATQGLYFQAFSNLSIGLERIGKLCLTLNHFIETNGKFPTEKHLKKEIGHDLVELYKKSQELILERDIKLRTLQKLDHPIHSNILEILSSFAKGDRYSNFNFLVSSSHQSNPTGEWYLKVDMAIYENDISENKKTTIKHNSALTGQFMRTYGIVEHISEQGTAITNHEDASHRTGVFEAVAPKRQLYILQMIRYWVEILLELQYLSMSINHEAIPYFNEILGSLSNDDSYNRTRKTWDKI